ncbi:hypothetical protein [Saccharolobus solfataricus]|uniref:hypothetical protein n=1 Tax=Saccharolobus solfataricus TaxID=2287 RepID=UPI001E55217E|nr:hypothetical protein [Saccharolobus solfataricus]
MNWLWIFVIVNQLIQETLVESINYVVVGSIIGMAMGIIIIIFLLVGRGNLVQYNIPTFK